MLLLLARKSLRQRRLTTGLTSLSIALSVCLLLGVDLIQLGARESFTGAISGTDLVVGPRSSPTQLVLHSLFGIGSGLGRRLRCIVGEARSSSCGRLDSADGLRR